MKEIIGKNKELIVAIAVVLILIVTGSYAWLTITSKSEKVNVIKAGSLSLTLDDETSKNISLVNAVPQSYQQGITGTEYTFTLKNEGTTASNYEIYLDDVATYTNDKNEEVTIDDTNRLGDNNIRFILLKNGELATPAKSHLLSHDPGRLIDLGTIEGKTQITYSLRIWIDSQSGTEVMGKAFNSKLRIEAIQAQ